MEISKPHDVGKEELFSGGAKLLGVIDHSRLDPALVKGQDGARRSKDELDGK
jgi:hypothetical protein